MSDITPAVRADLAPTGTLRAGVNYGHVILATKVGPPDAQRWSSRVIIELR